MRRLFPLVLVALTAVACSTDKSPETTPEPISGPPSATAAAASPAGTAAETGAPAGTGTATAGGTKGGDAALAGNTQAICDQAAKVTAQFGKTFADDVKLLIEAAAADNAAERTKEAELKTARDVQSYSFALKDLGELVADPKVKTALTSMSEEVTALKGDVRKLDAERLGGFSDDIDKACGRQ